MLWRRRVGQKSWKHCKRLYDATRRGDLTQLRAFLRLGGPDVRAAVNYQGTFGDTPLSNASTAGHINAVNVGLTALHPALFSLPLSNSVRGHVR